MVAYGAVKGINISEKLYFKSERSLIAKGNQDLIPKKVKNMQQKDYILYNPIFLDVLGSNKKI